MEYQRAQGMAQSGSLTDPFRLVGTTIEGKYRVDAVIGDGGFGVVYRGVHTGFDEPIGIKCLKIPTTLRTEERAAFLDQLREEGRILHRLSRTSPGIVQALDVGAFTHEDGTWVPFLVLEWLEGQTLAAYMRQREEDGEPGLTAHEAADLLEPAARALATAHAQKIAHRDVKPANLFLTRAVGKPTMKVLDFGIAKVFAEHATIKAALAATAESPSAFTPRYGAPEQFSKMRGATGPWTDVFALGLIFVELVTAKRALDGDDPTQLYIASADPSIRPTLRARGVATTDGIERVLARALHVEPQNRYPDAGAFWDDIERVVAEGFSGERVVTPRSVRRAGEDVSGLSTAEYAVATKLDVAVDSDNVASEQARRAVELAPTVASKPRPSGPAASVEPASDPMEETPIPDRSAPATANTSSKPQDLAPATRVSGAEPNKKSSLGWLVLAVLAVAAVAGYVLFSEAESPPSKRPVLTTSAKVPTSTVPKSSAAPQPVPSLSASSLPPAPPVSASASPPQAPPPPPEDMILVAPLTLKLGEGEALREITLSKPFFFDRREVTAKAYGECVAARRCGPAQLVTIPTVDGADPDQATKLAETWSKRCNAQRKSADHPINCVDFASAGAYCAFRGRRLPTEAEWETVARGAALRRFPWGDEAPDCARACGDRNGACVGQAAVVGTCVEASHAGDATSEGVFDLGGNVAEWVSDGFVPAPKGGTDPAGDPTAALRVVRGGSFLAPLEELRAARRLGVAPSSAQVDIGFRCALDVPAP